jgi:hypothetical protein
MPSLGINNVVGSCQMWLALLFCVVPVLCVDYDVALEMLCWSICESADMTINASSCSKCFRSHKGAIHGKVMLCISDTNGNSVGYIL